MQVLFVPFLFLSISLVYLGGHACEIFLVFRKETLPCLLVSSFSLLLAVGVIGFVHAQVCLFASN